MSTQQSTVTNQDPWYSSKDTTYDREREWTFTKFPKRAYQIGTFDPDGSKISTDETTFDKPDNSAVKKIGLSTTGLYPSSRNLGVDEVRIPGIVKEWTEAREFFKKRLETDPNLLTQLQDASESDSRLYRVITDMTGYKNGKYFGASPGRLEFIHHYYLFDYEKDIDTEKNE
ncbi:hypothetical protein I204_04267 [Kwoniella mangroviensis CBS 8886]|nr:hypothetical protein I204_04267 [Kwoniella mangroviensis CBS 8886]